MKKLNLFNRSGMGPDGTSRKGRYSLDPILSRLSVASLICLCMLTVGVGNVWADYTITFKTSGTSGLINTGGDYATSTETAYVSGTASGVQFGSNSKGGNILLTMTASGQIKASKITLNGYCKPSSNGGNCKCTYTYTDNTSSYTTVTATTTATATDVTLDGTKTLKSIKLESTGSKKKFYITGVTVVAAAASKTLSSIAISGTLTKSAYVAGETLDPSGLTVTATYSDATTANVTASTTWTPSPLTAGTTGVTASYTEGGTTKTATKSSCINVYGVTLQARDEDGNTIAGGGPGAPSRTGNAITPAADAGNYVFKQWQVTNASLGSSATTASNTITNPTGAVTVTAVYYKPITITYKANGQDFTTQTYARGGTLAFPASGPNGDTYSCTGKTFVGWVDEANKDYSHASIAPTYATAGGSVTAAATYYAVFATSAGELSNSYAAITSGLETANYVIAYSYNGGTQIVLKNAADNSSPSDKLEGYNLSLSASKYSNPGASYIWELQAQPDGSYYIYNANVDKYVNATTSALTLSTTPTKFTISYDGTNSRWTIQIKDNSTYYVHGYVNSTAYDFRVSTSGSGNRYRIYLYKQESNITYSAYATTCSTEPRLNVSPTSLDFGNVANGTYKELTFSLTGSYLTANASIGVSGTNSSYFSVTPSSVSKGSGTIAATDITVRYTPGAVADGHTATVTVSSTGATPKTVTLTGNCKASYTVTCSAASNGSVSADKTSNVMAGETVTLTITPSSEYQLSSISAVDGSSNPVSLTGTGNSRTFTMPASNVTVTATFVIRTDYVLVESALDDYSGEYLIAYRSSGTETLNVLSGRYNSKNSNTYGTYTNVWSYYDSGAKAIESNATTDAMKMVVEPGNISGRYTIYFANDNTYLAMTKGNKSTGAYLRFNENITSGYEYDWDFSWNTSSSVSEVAIHNNAASEGDKKWLWLLYNTGSPRFALYTSGADIELYKKVETCSKLDAPTGLTASSITQTTVTLSWTAVANASDYEISLDNGSSWTSTSTNTSYNATGLSAGTTYNWKVRATGDGETYCLKGNAAASTVTMKNAVTVTYNANGGSGTLPVAGGVVNLTEGDSYTVLGNIGSGGGAVLTKDGYTWAGWHNSTTYNATPAYTVGNPIIVNSNTTLYANWAPKRDTYVDGVHSNAEQYGDGADYEVPSCSDESQAASGACEVTHYKFIGWALEDADLTDPANIFKGGTKTATGATYYAVWGEEL